MMKIINLAYLLLKKHVAYSIENKMTKWHSGSAPISSESESYLRLIDDSLLRIEKRSWLVLYMDVLLLGYSGVVVNNRASGRS